MAEYKVTIKDEITYYIDAPTRSDAIDQALEYWDERSPEVTAKDLVSPAVARERASFIRQFDDYLSKGNVPDEVYANWLEVFPDGANETELFNLGLDNDTWLDLVQCFAECCKNIGVID